MLFSLSIIESSGVFWMLQFQQKKTSTKVEKDLGVLLMEDEINSAFIFSFIFYGFYKLESSL
ncbi:hypothetical protein CXF59_12390 [Flavobacterium sp. ALD4]|nr:hypothetical protein CXF59_12390 [Flavobacterium sp. ALD4]